MHQSAWPTQSELAGSTPELMNLTSAALILVRKSKSDLKLSMKAEIEMLKMTGPAQLNSVARDLQAVGNIAQLELSDASEIAITEIRFAKSE